jgi:hypothetical protein
VPFISVIFWTPPREEGADSERPPLEPGRLLGWSITDHLRTELCLDALLDAVGTRGGKANIDGVIFHSDHGCEVHR